MQPQDLKLPPSRLGEQAGERMSLLGTALVGLRDGANALIEARICEAAACLYVP